MFQRNFKPTKFVVPVPEATNLVTLDRIVRNNPVTVERTAPLRLPERLTNLLQSAWSQFDDESVDLNGFIFEWELHESQEGYAVLLVKWDGSNIDIGVSVFDEQDELETTFFASEIPKEWTTERLDRLWIRIDPVETIKNTEKQIQPNTACPCSSGRKYKKCCGRF